MDNRVLKIVLNCLFQYERSEATTTERPSHTIYLEQEVVRYIILIFFNTSKIIRFCTPFDYWLSQGDIIKHGWMTI